MKDKMVYLVAPKASTFVRAHTSEEAAWALIESARLFDPTIDYIVYPVEVDDGKAKKPRKPREPRLAAA